MQFGARRGSAEVSLDSKENSTDDYFDHAPLPQSGIASHP